MDFLDTQLDQVHMPRPEMSLYMHNGIRQLSMTEMAKLRRVAQFQPQQLQKGRRQTLLLQTLELWFEPVLLLEDGTPKLMD